MVNKYEPSPSICVVRGLIYLLYNFSHEHQLWHMNTQHRSSDPLGAYRCTHCQQDMRSDIPVWYLTERLHSDNDWVSHNKLQWLIECVGWYLFVFLFFRPPTGEKAFDILLMSRARGLEIEKNNSVQCGISQAGLLDVDRRSILVFGGVWQFAHSRRSGLKRKRQTCWGGGRNERRRVVLRLWRGDSWGESSQIPLTVTIQLWLSPVEII